MGNNTLGSTNRILLPILPSLPYTSQIYFMGSNIWQSQPQQQENLTITSNGSFKEMEPEVKLEIADDSDVATDFVSSDVGDQSKCITADTPLPNFSPRIRSHINDNDLSAVWGAFVEECAQHYYNICPNIQNSSEYQMIGKKMYAKYPTIEYEGKEPWSFFCKSLSQKIRHIKWKVKKAKAGASRRTVRRATRVLPAVKLRSINRTVVRKYIPGNQYKALLDELIDGFERQALSEERVKEILKETYKSRRAWVLSNSSGQLSPLFDAFPCFSRGKYVVHDFLMQLRKQDTTFIVKKFKDLFAATGKIMTPAIVDIDDMKAINILKYIEEQTSFNKGKACSSIIMQKEMLDDAEMLQCLHTAEKTPPHLMVFCDSEKIIKAFIVGDQKVIFVEESNFFYALVVLIATYHTFNLQYPKIFSQVLGLLQTYGVGIAFSGSKSNKYTLFIKKLLQHFSPQ